MQNLRSIFGIDFLQYEPNCDDQMLSVLRRDLFPYRRISDEVELKNTNTHDHCKSILNEIQILISCEQWFILLFLNKIQSTGPTLKSRLC